ncbi:MAG: stage 0 sporulation family protein [Clostridia bacterium]|nr:stage 0 sporulation family protein [Clostridia bacterium]
MTTVVGVRFRNSGKSYYFDPGQLELRVGDSCVVETARGMECGKITFGPTEMDDSRITQPLRQVIRKATQEDMDNYQANRVKEQEAFRICKEKIISRGIEMKLIDVEYTLDSSKILFYFTADGRVDFRDLVKDLATVFKTRIELRQVGVRDEAKMMGGLGICGRQVCCHSYMNDFHPVSIKMAKEQDLSLNPTKISGTCGRLMCCLKYESEAYEDLLARVPKVGSLVDTDCGRGVVTENNLLKEQVKVRIDGRPDGDQIVFKADEVKVIKRGSSKEERPADAAALKGLED